MLRYLHNRKGLAGMRQIARGVVLLSLFCTTGLNLSLSAQNSQPLYGGFTPILESEAYRLFKTRPITDYSKVIYLIDRFVDSKVEIVYDGRYYSATFVSRIARWFLARNYRRETPQQWIMKWCNTSAPAGNLIWVKLPNGRFRLSREILLEELNNLEAVLKLHDESASKKLEMNAIAIAQVVEAPAKTTPLETQEQTLRTSKSPKPQPLGA